MNVAAFLVLLGSFPQQAGDLDTEGTAALSSVLAERGGQEELQCRELSVHMASVAVPLPAAEDWRVLTQRLEAGRRNPLALSDHVDFATLCSHAQPNVRQAALEWAAVLGRAEAVPAEQRAARASDAWPPARRAYLTWLRRAWPAGAGEELLEGARRGDRGAIEELLRAGPRAAELQARFLSAQSAAAPSKGSYPLPATHERWLRGGGIAPEFVAALRTRAAEIGVDRGWIEWWAIEAGLEPDVEALTAAWSAMDGPLDAATLRLLEASAQRLAVQHPELARRLAGMWLEAPALSDAAWHSPEDSLGLAANLCSAEDWIGLLERQPPRLALAGFEELLQSGWLAPAQALAPWLGPKHDIELRMIVAELLGRQLDDPERGAEVGELLAQALRAASAGTGSDAAELAAAIFRDLASVEHPQPYVGVLHEAWLSLDEATRARRWRELPRGVTLTPFRGELLAALASGTLEASAVELCAPLEGAALILQRAAVACVESLPPESSSARTAYLRALLAARGVAGGGGLVDQLTALGRALVQKGGPRADLAKHALAALAKAESKGRVAKPVPWQAWLDSELPQRVRLEAGLSVISNPKLRDVDLRSGALDVLIDGFEDCDRTLRARTLVAFAQDAAPTSLAWLVVRAGDSDLAFDERLRALEGLLRRGAHVELARLALEPLPFELALAWLRGARSRPAVPELRAAVERGVTVLHVEGQEAEDLLAAELLLARVELELVSVQEALEGLNPLLESEAEILEQRLDGRSGADLTSRFEFELRLIDVLMARGASAAVIEALEPLAGLDGRLGMALSERFSGEARLQLALRAWIAVQGEAPANNLGATRVEALLNLLQAAEAAGRFELYALLCERLLEERSLGFGGARAFERRLGMTRPRAGVDPVARLRAGAWQARAWAAWQAGDQDAAKRAAQRASGWATRSAAAGRAQARLEALWD